MENLPRGRRSRRSSSNLNLSNISPLTTHFSMTALDEHLSNIASPQTSYIQKSSAPSTPSILSRASSRRRTRPHVPTASVPGTPRPDVKISKAKSASHLLLERRATYFGSHPVRRNESTEWVHRAGIALTSEARESKGQSWLASRASSTSLLSNESDDEDESRMIPRRESRSYSEFHTPRSRNGSEATIRRTRSRVQEDLHLEIPDNNAHPWAPEFIDEAFVGDSFDEDEDDAYSSDELDDEELHWSKRPRTGLGAWVDRMVGWSLFSVDDEIDSEEEEQEPPAQKAVHEPPRLTIPDFSGGKNETEEKPQAPEFKDGSVWSDASWVLGLTAKVILQG